MWYKCLFVYCKTYCIVRYGVLCGVHIPIRKFVILALRICFAYNQWLISKPEIRKIYTSRMKPDTETFMLLSEFVWMLHYIVYIIRMVDIWYEFVYMYITYRCLVCIDLFAQKKKEKNNKDCMGESAHHVEYICGITLRFMCHRGPLTFANFIYSSQTASGWCWWWGGRKTH